MKKRLRVKFAILYALFALLSFLTVSTFGMSLARKYVTKSVADGLYQDAIIYVGKAVSLKNRVRQYFQASRNCRRQEN